MSGKLQKEIHKARPFDCVQQEAYLNVVRTADHLGRAFEILLKPHHLSATQYNVLRILRGMSQNPGASPDGIPCKIVAEHMITRDPDITRLLNRLEARNLIARKRDTKDRRIIFACITETGLKLLADLDAPMHNLHIQQLSHMPEPAIHQVIDLLEQMRTPA